MPGVELKSIPFVAASVEGAKADAPALTNLHSVLFGGDEGTEATRKSKILSWSGSDDKDAIKEALSDKSTFKAPQLKQIAKVLGLDAHTVDVIVDFLAEPADHGKEAPAKKGKKAAAGGGKKKGKKAAGDKPKRPKNSFMLFADDTRGKIVSAHPDWQLGEVGKELGRLWRELSESEKGKYKAAAEKLKQAALAKA